MQKTKLKSKENNSHITVEMNIRKFYFIFIRLLINLKATSYISSPKYNTDVKNIFQQARWRNVVIKTKSCFSKKDAFTKYNGNNGHHSGSGSKLKQFNKSSNLALLN